MAIYTYTCEQVLAYIFLLCRTYQDLYFLLSGYYTCLLFLNFHSLLKVVKVRIFSFNNVAFMDLSLVAVLNILLSYSFSYLLLTFSRKILLSY